MSEQLDVEEQRVRDLIVGAGPRAAPPAEEVTRIKQAARAEWREMVDRERRRGRGLRLRGALALAASVVAALVVGWWWASRAPVAAPVVARVELVAGAVRGADAGRLAVGGELRAGSAVETGGWLGGSAAGTALRLGGGQSLRLAADTRVLLVSESRLELEHGTLYVDADSTAGVVEVVTALGTVRDVGTQFEVRLSEGGAAIRVRVREGECSLGAAGESYRAVRGEQISRLADGSITRATIEPYGPEWDWVMATAPSIAIDGRSLAEVLRWVEREMGRDVRYADADLSAFAEGAILSGPSEGLAPVDILQAVLLANSLRHEVGNGTILVSR